MPGFQSGMAYPSRFGIFTCGKRRLIENFVLLNHAILVKQKRRERVHLIRLERTFLPERHARD